MSIYLDAPRPLFRQMSFLSSIEETSETDETFLSDILSLSEEQVEDDLEIYYNKIENLFDLEDQIVCYAHLLTLFEKQGNDKKYFELFKNLSLKFETFHLFLALAEKVTQKQDLLKVIQIAKESPFSSTLDLKRLQEII